MNNFSDDNCEWLLNRVGDLFGQSGQLGASDELIMSQSTLCLSLSSGVNSVKSCQLASSRVSFQFTSLDIDTYHISLTGHHTSEEEGVSFVELFPGFSEVELPLTTLTISPSECVKRPRIRQPLHGGLLGPLVELNIELESDVDANNNTSLLCLSLDGERMGCHKWPPIDKPYLRHLLPGRHGLEVWLNDTAAISRCKTVSVFEVTMEEPAASRTAALNIVSSSSSHLSNLVFVTGASQRYYDEGILQNLIGSIHQWEAEATIEVFDFGLDSTAQRQIARWRNVKLKHLPKQTLVDGSQLPPHFFIHGFGAYAAKPWVTLDALERATKRAQFNSDSCEISSTCEGSSNQGSSVFWIDANTELRRPLSGSEMLDWLHARGGFFVTHPYGFPSTQFHHPSTVASLGCPSNTTPSSLPHCATTFMGFTTASQVGLRVIDKVLRPLVACGLNESCVFPPGSSRANHRQEQTALNALLCKLSHGVRHNGNAMNHHNISSFSLCSIEDRYKLTSDFENRNNKLQPTSDPTAWNDMSFYTRRRHPTKPYIPFLQMD